MSGIVNPAAAGGGGGAPVGAEYVVTTAHADLTAEKVLGADVNMAGTAAAIPAAGIAGRLYFATDSGQLFRDTGASWTRVAIADLASAPDALPVAKLPSEAVRKDQGNVYSAGRQDLSAAAGFAVPNVAGAPAGAGLGELYYDTAAKALRANLPTKADAGLVGLLKSQGAVQAGDTVANTTTETTFATSYTLPANAIAAGKVIRVTARGVLSTAATGPTLTLRLKLDTTTLLSSGAMAVGASRANAWWFLQAEITYRGSGSPANVEIQGWVNTAFVVGTSAGNAAEASLATNVNRVLGVSAAWGTANASNTITMRSFVVEVLD